MKRKLVYIPGILLFSLMLIGWGGTGHGLIGRSISLFFNQEMEQFNSWVSYIDDHSSDADDRKSVDPSESPKHYIDIDYYTEFITEGRIPQTLDSVITLYGSFNVYDWGILPWATITTYDSLKNCFIRRDFERAKYFAADLSHYVGDGHMPLHITKNYNGQLTDNDGIHSRYESTMINAHASQIVFSGSSISQIQDVQQYIFNYLYANYQYVDSILNADDYAKSINSSTSSSEYKTALWNKTRNFTIILFRNASHALTELIYTAWKEAGSPSLTGINDHEQLTEISFSLDQNYPNPFTDLTYISYSLKSTTWVNISVVNSQGRVVSVLVDNYFTPGSYQVEWCGRNFPGGVYFVKMADNNDQIVTKMLLVK